MMGWHDFGYGMSGGGWLAMTISIVLFWGLVVTAAVLLLRTWRRPSEPPPPAPPSAEAVLAERFARGEIDEDEFRRRLAALTGVGSAAADAPPGVRH